jgi:hypothetical protein
MRPEMEWGREKQAGFLLAALLAEDQDLSLVGPSLGDEVRAMLQSTRAAGDAAAREAEARSIAEWLRLLRPELDASAVRLPARIRSVLAPIGKGPLKAQLRADGRPVRADFSPEAGLLATLMRIARHAARKESP